MLEIPGYDEWKTRLPDDESYCQCDCCGGGMYRGESYYNLSMILEGKDNYYRRVCRSCIDYALVEDLGCDDFGET